MEKVVWLQMSEWQILLIWEAQLMDMKAHISPSGKLLCFLNAKT